MIIVSSLMILSIISGCIGISASSVRNRSDLTLRYSSGTVMFWLAFATLCFIGAVFFVVKDVFGV